MNDITWQPSAQIEDLRQRMQIERRIRAFFYDRNYLEVSTPIMAQHGISDVYLANIKAQCRGKTTYLQTSPEYHMKRLLVAGSGPIFQINRVFRDDELGRWHNPEFTMLEWYQLGIDHHQLMDEVDSLLQDILNTPPMLRMTYADAFAEICGLNPHTATCDEYQEVLVHHELNNVLSPGESDKDQYLFLIMSHIIEPALANYPVPVALYHFPVTQASLAQIKEGVAERFEVYYKGVELANGFHELSDVTEQAQRFAEDNRQREAQGLNPATIDPYFLAALQEGLPHCAGVALGVDRLIALALGYDSIAKVLSFDFHRA